MKQSDPVRFCGDFWRSPLPRLKDLAFFRDSGGATVVDLTQRDRPQIARWCESLGIEYIKLPTPYEGFDADAIAATVATMRRPVLIHCFHGRDRAGAVAAAIERLASAD